METDLSVRKYYHVHCHSTVNGVKRLREWMNTLTIFSISLLGRMSICQADGCYKKALLDSRYCGLHIHKDVDDPLGKAATAAGGALMHTVMDTNTLNNGMELTSDLIDKCDTTIGKVIVGATGTLASEAASMVVQGVKHIGTVVKLINFFDDW